MPDIIIDDAAATELAATWALPGDWPTAWKQSAGYTFSPTDTATYPVTGMINGQRYQVYASWNWGGNRTTVAQVVIKGAGGATLGTATYNQQVPTSGVIRNDGTIDVTFQLLTTITADGTTGSIVLGMPTETDGTKIVYADAFLYVPVASAVRRALKWFKRRRADGTLTRD